MAEPPVTTLDKPAEAKYLFLCAYIANRAATFRGADASYTSAAERANIFTEALDFYARVTAELKADELKEEALRLARLAGTAP